MKGRIIVATTLSREFRGLTCVAHLRPLGLTAYGENTYEAEVNVKALFNRFINEYRRLGVLEARLTNHFQVSWWPEDKYDGDLVVEDTSPGASLPGSGEDDRDIAWIEAA